MKLKRWAGAVFAAAAIVALAGCSSQPGAGTNHSWSSVVLDAATVTISGTQDVMCSNGLGCDGFADFTDGTQATLVDETGKTVGVTQLSQASGGSNLVYKSFVFTFTDVPHAVRYGFHAGNANRGVVWLEFGQAKTAGIHVTVGS